MGKSKSDGAAFSKKWDKILTKMDPDFKGKAESMSTDELKKKIIQCQHSIGAAEKDLENDQVILGIKEDLKQKTSVYKDDIARESAISKYAVFLLESRGAG